MSEPVEARLARIEEKLDGHFSRVSDRCSSHTTRLDSMDKTLGRFGERLGRLEADREQRRGGKTAVMALLAGGGVMGGALVKLLEIFGRSS